jgi:hypothetical protein
MNCHLNGPDEIDDIWVELSLVPRRGDQFEYADLLYIVDNVRWVVGPSIPYVELFLRVL